MAVIWTIAQLERNTDDGVGADDVEASIAAQIAESKEPAIVVGVPW